MFNQKRKVVWLQRMATHMAKSTKICDTTREERIRIVWEALSWGDDCGDCSLDACGIDKYYLPYIDGQMELSELNMAHASGSYVTGDAGILPDSGCMM